jgi:hypothetical protein
VPAWRRRPRGPVAAVAAGRAAVAPRHAQVEVAARHAQVVAVPQHAPAVVARGRPVQAAAERRRAQAQAEPRPLKVEASQALPAAAVLRGSRPSRAAGLQE